MHTTMLILLICVLTQVTAFGELTKQDLEAIQKVVKEEISDSEQRTDIKLTEINTEIKVIQTDIQGVKDRIGDIRGLVIGVIGLIAIIVVVASAMTHAAGKLGGTMTKIQKIYASNDETQALIKLDTAAKEETNRLLSEYTKRHEEQNAHLADIQAKLNEMATFIKESIDESNESPIAHAPAD